jgi:Flp pilus assembly CpaE family ATPase
MATLIAADPDEDFGKEITLVFKKKKEINIRGTTTKLSELKELLIRHKPTILLLGPGWERETILSYATGLKMRSPSINIIWMVEEIDQELAGKARKAKIQNLLQVPVELDNLTAAIAKAHRQTIEMVKTAREAEAPSEVKTVEVEIEKNTDGTISLEPLAPDGLKEQAKEKMEPEPTDLLEVKPEIRLVNKLDATLDAAHESKPLPLPKILTVFSTKGGVGKTVIAVNLAVCLAQKKGLKTILADFDLQSGDVGVMLKLQPQRTIYDCLTTINQLEAETLSEFLTPHSSGLNTLQAPVEPALADLISSTHVKQILKAAKNRAEFVIVDTPPFFNDNVLATLDLSDIVLLVVTMDVPSVKNVKLCLETLRLLGYPPQKIKLAINRADADVGLRQAEVEKALGLKASLVLPNEPGVILSVNNGVPMVSGSPRSPIARAIRGFVEELVYAPAPSVERSDYEREIV